MTLAEYLEKTGEPITDFAKRAGISIHTLRKYKTRERKRPGARNEKKIRIASNNKVTGNDWYDD